MAQSNMINAAPEYPNMYGTDEIPTPKSTYLGSLAGVAGRVFSVPGAGSPTPGTPAVPAQPNTAAQDAASAAATRALDAKYGPSNNDQTDRGVTNGRLAAAPGAPAPAAVDPNANVSAWNAHVQNVTKALQNLGIQNAGQVLAQTPPSMDKSAGQALVQGGGIDGKGGNTLLNYGYGSTIVGSGMGGKNGKTLNSFTGVGSGAAPAGAAGVFGAPPPAGGTPFDQMHSQILALSQQAQAKMAAGDGIGARRIEAHMGKLAGIFQTLSSHQYQQGELGVQQSRQALAENVANPGLLVALQQAGLIHEGKLDEARKVAAAHAGNNLNPMQNMQMYSYGYNPNSGASPQWLGAPPEIQALMKR